jgi:hypothetical protein
MTRARKEASMKRTATLLVLLVALGALAAAAAAEGRGPAYTFTFSGYLKADVAYDRARVSSGDYAIYVLDKVRNDLLSMTARESRLGVDFSWKEGDVRTDGRFEFDFYGLGVSSASPTSQENKAAPMLRHAYAQVTKGRWSLLAGQTSDIISPLVPKTVNYTVCWDQGNIGYRRPQVRVSTWADATDKVKVNCAVGAFRNIGGDLDGDGIDDGADAAIPVVEGRLGLAAKLCDTRTLDVGVSGHYGREEYKASDVEQDVDSWSANGDLRFVCKDRFEAAGELFVGENLGTYYGGVGQTVNLDKKPIGARGGWGQLSYRPAKGLWLNIGYSVDDPDDEDFVLPEGTAGTKSFFDKNQDVFGSAMYDLTSTVTLMLEVSQLTTTYLYKEFVDDALETSSKDFDDTRVQFALKAAIK